MTAPERILGIESSCDDTAAAVVVRGREVLSNVVESQVAEHQVFGGVVPEIAGRSHLDRIVPVVDRALGEAGSTLADIDGIAVTCRPGLIGSLLVGLSAAKGLAWATGLPLVGVHHIEAHCWAAMLDGAAGDGARPRLPALALAVSGGHTSLFRMDGPGEVALLGQTLDDAAGEALDKFGKIIGLPYPAGPIIDRLAERGDRERFPLPRGMRGRDDLAMSFSGLKTAGRQLAEALAAEGEDVLAAARDDLCASYQEAAVAQLVDTTMRALDRTRLKDLVIAGGVAANSRLRERMAEACAARGVAFWPVAPRLCTDNGAMVAGLGSSLLARGVRDDPLLLDAAPTARPAIAEVRASARGARR